MPAHVAFPLQFLPLTNALCAGCHQEWVANAPWALASPPALREGPLFPSLLGDVWASTSPSAQWESAPPPYLAFSGSQFPHILGQRILAVPHQNQWLASGSQSSYLPHRQTCLFSRPGHCWAGDAVGTTQCKQNKLGAPIPCETQFINQSLSPRLNCSCRGCEGNGIQETGFFVPGGCSIKKGNTSRSSRTAEPSWRRARFRPTPFPKDAAAPHAPAPAPPAPASPAPPARSSRKSWSCRRWHSRGETSAARDLAPALPDPRSCLTGYGGWDGGRSLALGRREAGQGGGGAGVPGVGVG